MSLNKYSLRDLIDKIIEIDSFKSKMGSDEDIITISFSASTKEAADDLCGFIERGYSFVLDADVTAGEQDDGTYKVFVEMERDNSAIEQILELVDGVSKLANIDAMKFRYYKNFRSMDIDTETLTNNIPLDVDQYGIKVNESNLNNYKNFFNKSFVESIHMRNDNITIKKSYADALRFKFVKFGPTQETLDSLSESFNPWDFAEIIFLSKYVGDYNITKYGNKLAFENEGNTLVVERIIY